MAWLTSTTSPASGRIDIGGRFHGFDDRRTIAFRERGAHLGQLDEYDAAEQVRRVSGDAYRRNVPFEP
jgi:hypothetical protein